MPKANEKNIVFPEPHKIFTEKRSLRKYLKYLLFFGPGAILASMTIGQGQLIIGPQIGAWAGFTLLWLITLNLGSYVITYVSSRFTMLSGISMIDLFAVKTKKSWINWLFIAIILFFVPIFTAAIITTLGQSLAWIMGFGHYLIWGISFCLLAALLVILGRYKALEFAQALFVAILGIGAIISIIILKPDFIEILPNYFLIGNTPAEYPAWVDLVEGFNKTPIPLIMLGYLGTLTISLIPLIGYLGWIKVKKWGIFKDKENPEQFSQHAFSSLQKEGKINYLPRKPSEIHKSRLLLRPLVIDLVIAFIIVSIVSSAYMLAGSYLLGPQPDGSYLLPSDVNLLREQAVIFSNIAAWLKPLYQISVFFALFGTVYAGFEAASRMLYETFGSIRKTSRNIPYKKFMLYLMIYLLSLGIPLSILMYYGVSVLLLLSITLLFIGVIGVIIYGIGATYMSQKILPKEYKFSTPGVILIVLAIILMMVPMLFFFI